MTGLVSTADGLDGLLATMVAPPVSITAEYAARFAHEQYGLVADVTRLTGERDENFRLCTSGADFVLKIAPAAEDPLVTDLQIAALLHIEHTDPALPCPRVCRDRAGRTQVRFADIGGHMRTGRLLSWLPGVPVRSVDTSPTQQAACARLAAGIGRALRSFSHPAARRALIWDLRVLPRLLPLLDEMPEFPRRDLVAKHMAEFQDQVLPRLSALREQVIHNDFNDRNILVDPADPARITGIIDYGDMIHAPLICDLAILAAGQMTHLGTLDEAIARFAAAYQELVPLTAAETGILRRLIGARILMSTVIPSWHRRRNPDGGHYARVTPEFVHGRLAIAEILFGE